MPRRVLIRLPCSRRRYSAVLGAVLVDPTLLDAPKPDVGDLVSTRHAQASKVVLVVVDCRDGRNRMSAAYGRPPISATRLPATA